MAGNTGPAHFLLDNPNFAKYPTITETQGGGKHTLIQKLVQRHCKYFLTYTDLEHLTLLLTWPLFISEHRTGRKLSDHQSCFRQNPPFSCGLFSWKYYICSVIYGNYFHKLLTINQNRKSHFRRIAIFSFRTLVKNHYTRIFSYVHEQVKIWNTKRVSMRKIFSSTK
jgi:hypothetical protein